MTAITSQITVNKELYLKAKETFNSSAEINSSLRAQMKALERVDAKLAKMTKEEIEDSEEREQYEKIMLRIGSIINLENHNLVASSLSDDYRGFAIQFAESLIEEHQCTTSAEKALAQAAATSYSRYLEINKNFTNCNYIEFLSSEKNGFYSMLSKAADRAHRQFVSSISTLKQLKAPSLSVNVKANTAFVAQNQQLNTNQESNAPK